MRFNNFSENMKKCHDYIKGLEEERRKIQVFERELPLCLELITQAIETCKQQLSGTTTTECNLQGQLSECSEQTSSFIPVFEEFMPIKRASFGEQQESKKEGDDSGEQNPEKLDWDKKDGDDSNEQNCQKSEWLRSVQLWNQTSDPISKEVIGCQELPKNLIESEVKNDVTGGGPVSEVAVPPPSTSSGGGNKKEGRKSRRSWSPELHRKFLQALKQIGGPRVATPKQIREFMKVDGLTNDEVKSHLQKYRLHTRTPSTTIPNINAQPPQFVVVGGLWMPSEYASMATTTTSTEAPVASKIYAPVAAPPPPFQEPPYSPNQMQHIIKHSSSAHTAAVPPAC